MFSEGDLSLDSYSHVFLDFDGVIKDSNKVKEDSFVELFPDVDESIKTRIRQHHNSNLGVSRYVKIPIYASYAQVSTEHSNILSLQSKFSSIVINSVIDSDWMPGAITFLERYSVSKNLILLTATPTDEIIHITERLKINTHFNAIYGSPMNKSAAIFEVLKAASILSSQCLFIGDAYTDFKAAEDAGIDFCWVSNTTCMDIQIESKKPRYRIENLLEV